MLPYMSAQQDEAQADRLTLVRRVCRRRGLSSGAFDASGNLGHDRYKVVRRHRIMYCSTPKVGRGKIIETELCA